MSSRELASGKLVVDEPAEHVARLRISNPEKRGALDHEILDALAEEVRGQEADHLLVERQDLQLQLIGREAQDDIVAPQ